MRKLKPEFVAMLAQLPELEGLAEALATTEAEVSVRRIVGDDDDHRLGDEADRVPWCPQGFYLPQRPVFTLDPAMHQGRYYVQDASSMFIYHVVKSLSAGPSTLLDACAAPGGKTTAAIDALPEGSVVVANEYVASRANVLVENITKWGYEATIVTRGDTSRLSRLADEFDIALVDAPCSGEGMMRKEAKAVDQWSAALVEECATLQREILANVWPTVKPGGYLVYSTCTFNRRENEENLQYLVDTLGAEPAVIDIDPAWGIAPGIATSLPCYRFLPGRIRGEGLFLAVVRKPLSSTSRRPPDKQRPDKRRGNSSKSPLLPRLPLTGADWIIEERGDDIKAFPAAHEALLRRVQKCADVLHYGVTVGVRAGRDIAPTQSLAMARRLDREVYPSIEVSRDTALDYLRRQAVTLSDGSPRGYILLTYGDHPLGFVKNLGNRANNLYPKEWRILNV